VGAGKLGHGGVGRSRPQVQVKLLLYAAAAPNSVFY
jgi:hypothetical protein